MNNLQYMEECNKFFAPLDEIQEAILNEEGLRGLTFTELKFIIDNNCDLRSSLNKQI